MSRIMDILLACFSGVERVFVCQDPHNGIPDGCEPGRQACCDPTDVMFVGFVDREPSGRRKLRAREDIESRDAQGQIVDIHANIPHRIQPQARYELATCFDTFLALEPGPDGVPIPTSQELYNSDVDDCCPPRCVQTTPNRPFATCNVWSGADWPPAGHCLRVDQAPPHIFFAGGGGIDELPALFRTDFCNVSFNVPCWGRAQNIGCEGEHFAGQYYLEGTSTPTANHKVFERFRVTNNASFSDPLALNTTTPQPGQQPLPGVQPAPPFALGGGPEAKLAALNQVMDWLRAGNTVGGVRFDQVTQPLVSAASEAGPVYLWQRSVDLEAAGISCSQWPTVVQWPNCYMRDGGQQVTVDYVVKAVFWDIVVILYTLVFGSGVDTDRQIWPICRANLVFEMGFRPSSPEVVFNGSCVNPRSTNGDSIVYVDNQGRTFDWPRPPSFGQWKGATGSTMEAWDKVYSSNTDPYRSAGGCGFSNLTTCCAVARAVNGLTIPAHPWPQYEGSLALELDWSTAQGGPCPTLEECLDA